MRREVESVAYTGIPLWSYLTSYSFFLDPQKMWAAYPSLLNS